MLRELLGVGGFGEVWLAHKGTELAALKFCLDPVSARTLHTEANLLKRVQEENQGDTGLVHLQASYLDADPPCLVFDYIPGGDLTRLIRCWHDSQTSSVRLVWESVRLLRRLAEILCCAHRLTPPVVHRDIKPSNILLQPTRPNRVKLCVADFGIGGVAAQASSRSTSAKEALTTGLRGAHTPLYASPQQKEGHLPTPSDDIYALGVIGYQILMGDTTIAPSAWMQEDLTRKEVPEKLIEVLAECLADEAEDRPTNAAQLIQTLEELLRQLPRATKATGPLA